MINLPLHVEIDLKSIPAGTRKKIDVKVNKKKKYMAKNLKAEER